MTSRTQLVFLLCLVLMLPTSLIAQIEPDAPRDLGRNEERSPIRDSAPTGIRGQIVSDSPGRLVHPIPVRLENFGVTLETVFTDGAGNFTFDNIQQGNVFYIVIDELGFRPVRERVDYGVISSVPGGMPVVILMEGTETEGDSIGDPDAVDLNQLISDIPEEAVEAFRKAADESQDGDYERAAQYLEEAVEIAPDFYEAQNALGVEYQRLARLDEAIGRFEIAMELNPNAAEPVLSLGILYLQDTDLQLAESKTEEAQTSFDKSFGYLEEAVERDATSASAQYYFGVALFKTGANQQALDRLNRALALNEQLYSVRLMLANVYIAEGDREAALDQLETYISEYPDSPQREPVERMKAELEQR